MKAYTSLSIVFYYVLFFLYINAQQFPNPSAHPTYRESYLVTEIGFKDGQKIFEYVPLLPNEHQRCVEHIQLNESLAYQQQFCHPNLSTKFCPLKQNDEIVHDEDGYYVQTEDFVEHGNFIIDPAVLSTTIPQEECQETPTEVISIKKTIEKDSLNLKKKDSGLMTLDHKKNGKKGYIAKKKNETFENYLQSLGNISIERIKIFLDNHKQAVIEYAKKGDYLAQVALGRKKPRGDQSYAESWAIALCCYETKDFDLLENYRQFCDADIIKCIEQSSIQTEFLLSMDQKKFDRALEIKKKFDTNHVHLKSRVFEAYSALLQYEEKRNLVKVSKQNENKQKTTIITKPKATTKSENQKKAKNNSNAEKSKKSDQCNIKILNKNASNPEKKNKQSNNQKHQVSAKPKSDHKKKSVAQSKFHKKIQSDYKEIVDCTSVKNTKKLVAEFISKYEKEKSIDEIVPLTVLKTGVIEGNNPSSVLLSALWIYCVSNNCYEKIFSYREKLPEGWKKKLRDIEDRYTQELKKINEDTNQETIIKFIKDYKFLLEGDNNNNAQLLLKAITHPRAVDKIFAEQIDWQKKCAKLEELNCFGKQLRCYRDFYIIKSYPLESQYCGQMRMRLESIDTNLLDDKNRRIAQWLLGQVIVLDQAGDSKQKEVNQSKGLGFLLESLLGKQDKIPEHRAHTIKEFEHLLEQNVYTENQLNWLYLYIRFYWDEDSKRKDCNKLTHLLIDRKHYPTLLFLGSELKKSTESYRYCALGIMLSNLGGTASELKMRDKNGEIKLFDDIKNIITQMPGTLTLFASTLKWAKSLGKEKDLIACLNDKTIACSSTEFHYLVEMYMTLVKADKPLFADGMDILKQQEDGLSQYLHRILSLYMYASHFYIKKELISIMEKEDTKVDDNNANMFDLHAQLSKWVRQKKLNQSDGIDYQFAELLKADINNEFRMFLTEWLQERKEFDSRYRDHIDELFCLIIEKYLNFDDYDMSVVGNLGDRQAFHKLDTMCTTQVETWRSLKDLLEKTLKSESPKIWYASHINLGYFIACVEKRIDSIKKMGGEVDNRVITEYKKAYDYSQKMIADERKPVTILYNTINPSMSTFFHNLLNNDIFFDDYFLMLDAHLQKGFDYRKSIEICDAYSKQLRPIQKLCKYASSLLLLLDGLKNGILPTDGKFIIDEKVIITILACVLESIEVDPNNEFLAFALFERIYCILFCHNKISEKSDKIISNEALEDIVWKWAEKNGQPLIMPRIMKYIETNKVYANSVFEMLSGFLKKKK